MKELMLEKGYTTKSLADALGLDNVTVWRWVNGRAKPGPESTVKLVQLGLINPRRQELIECLRWYVETDESTEEDEFYWEGKQRAIRALENA